jgi:hypothetical protein
MSNINGLLYRTKDYEKKDLTDPAANKSRYTNEGVVSFDGMLHEYRVPEGNDYN